MGWRFRKQKSVGPLRFTPSKGGLTVSVKGTGASYHVGGDARRSRAHAPPAYVAGPVDPAHQVAAGPAPPTPAWAKVLLVLLVAGALVVAATVVAWCGSVLRTPDAPQAQAAASAPPASPASLVDAGVKPVTNTPTRSAPAAPVVEPSGGGCTCRDGTSGCCGRGCCSHHGGVL